MNCSSTSHETSSSSETCGPCREGAGRRRLRSGGEASSLKLAGWEVCAALAPERAPAEWSGRDPAPSHAPGGSGVVCGGQGGRDARPRPTSVASWTPAQPAAGWAGSSPPSVRSLWIRGALVAGTAAWRWAGRGVRGRLGRVAPLTGTVAGAKIGETERRLKACWRDCCLLRQLCPTFSPQKNYMLDPIFIIPSTLRPSHRLLTEEIAWVHLEHLECSHKPRTQGRELRSATQLARCSRSGCGLGLEKSPDPGGCAVAGRGPYNKHGSPRVGSV